MKTRIKVTETNKGTTYRAQVKMTWIHPWEYICKWELPYEISRMTERTLKRAKSEIDFVLSKKAKLEAYKASIKTSYIKYP
jgi:hypothetical protein